MKSLVLCCGLAALCPAATQNFDVVVYGGTAAGVIAAVSAAREGLRTALLEPGAHLAEWFPAASASPITARRK